MGLGSTAKKLQTVADIAEKLYTKVVEIREQVEAMKGSVEGTEARVESIERELAEQRALVEAVADAEGIDVDAVTDAVDLAEATVDTDAESDSDTTGASSASDAA